MTVVLRVIRNDATIRARRFVRGRAELVFPTIVEPIVEPLETVVAHSIEEFGRREWDSLFLDELEDWYYLRALERAEVERCEPIYFAIRSRGRLVAAAPAFVGRRALAAPWRDARARAVAALAGARARARLAARRGLRIGVAPRTTPAERRLLADDCCWRRDGAGSGSRWATRQRRRRALGEVSGRSRCGSRVDRRPRRHESRCRAGRSRTT